MEFIITALLLILMVGACQSANQQRFFRTFYLAENRALLNQVFQWKIASSTAICGRDCSMDLQCVSFNYHIMKRICALNNASRAHSPDELIKMQGSVYYDQDVNNPTFSASSIKYHSSCMMLYQAGYRYNGVFTIFPTSLTDELQVYCDMETDGGGWIVVQRRQDGSADFNRTWADYQTGFGDLKNEFWFGNDILRDLTGSGQWQLRIDLEDWQSNTSWASYGQFAVGLTGGNYRLQVGLYDESSSAGDSMAYSNGHPFSTKDRDNDKFPEEQCAVDFHGGWWFDVCHHANLNGYYYQQPDVKVKGEGLIWFHWTGLYYSLKTCSMKLRQVV
ncbi:fibrinogen-like protein 1 [Asterias amurensis]|uniref:fibrinogen-like protein 1 n=1 Tax=Asterias amurensis TaxID=7602 RepID=UPI003AB537FD